MGRDGMDNLVRLGFSMRKSADDMALDCITARQLDLAAATAAVPLAVAVVAGQRGSSSSSTISRCAGRTTRRADGRTLSAVAGQCAQ